MNPIELGKAIADVGVPVITAVMLILVVGLVWFLIKRQTNREDKKEEQRIIRENKQDEQQKEDREYYRGLVTGELKDLHKDSLKNAELNQESINISERHSKESKASNLKISGILKNLLKSSNGNNPAIMNLINRMDEYEKEKEEVIK